METNINIETLHTFFKEEIRPKDFAEMLDKFLYNYIRLLIRSLKVDDILLHEDTDQFVYYIKVLRDILEECE